MKGVSFTALSWQGSVNDFLSDPLFLVTVLWVCWPTFSPSEGRQKPINVSSEDSCFQEHWFCLLAPSPFLAPLALCYNSFKHHWTRTLSVAYCPHFIAVFSEVVWPTYHRIGGRALPAFPYYSSSFSGVNWTKVASAEETFENQQSVSDFGCLIPWDWQH